ncbi:hypothetical protein MOV66_02890 [Agrobacterium sp. SHOUNA12C]|jgi:hypothetical protein|uniref:Uncharacterized protein n=1 Tax=Rhizobium rhizogenes (strain K84 / ATCC BAA-868) TaxID=311403 RepID=B9JGH4_RHIR8|nr:hypothetical protein [Rhizobium rhizogenes]ACM26948.1 hypothetical protein Arad_2864 [Rhizobium rhizogenes K84]MCJ9720191.1 hypothetical protein [Agrobacterium sp. BETTINA12B]MCJ9755580.1 hypothetical protein [Agrobacterium sp. SHOUNA12C]MDJ1636079.1 hypothetical protein [Rhizobium rhizogenes]NTF48854.1 hypothetical protein [Rhizobium rhizogenes]
MISDETDLAREASHLQRCWEAAYAAFSGYSAPEILNASQLRDPEKILRDLRSASMPELSGNALGGYAMWAITTVGGVEEYKHYLPRILQHSLLTPSEPGFDPLIILSKLEYTDWYRWPASECFAIENVYSASWHWARLQHPDEFDAMNWFVCAIRLEKDINSVLESWLTNLTPNSALQFTEVINRSDSLPYGEASWEDLDLATRRTIASWLCDDALQTAITEIVDNVADRDMWRIDSVEATLANLGTKAWR